MPESLNKDQCSSTAAGKAAPGLPQCCGTGCTVCVLDYPELFLGTETSSQNSEMLAMLEAFEMAQTKIANPDGKT